MQLKNKVILIGAFCEIVELCEECQYEIVGIVDELQESHFMGIPIIGNDAVFIENKDMYIDIPLIVVPDSPFVREKLSRQYSDMGYRFAMLISPRANISRYAKIGTGTVIQSGCNVSAGVVLGDFVKLNTNANIMHESQVEDFATVAPNAVVLGRCRIESKAYVGANATVLPTRTIGTGAIVGAGAVVTRNVESDSVVVGNPARVMEKSR